MKMWLIMLIGIKFYKKLISESGERFASPRPYYYLIDNLIADHRTKEARNYLKYLEEYPEGCVEAMQEKFETIVVDADGIARELGNAKCMNVVLFGAICDKLGEDGIDWEEIVKETVPAKALELNIKAFHAGRAAAGME